MQQQTKPTSYSLRRTLVIGALILAALIVIGHDTPIVTSLWNFVQSLFGVLAAIAGLFTRRTTSTAT